MCRVLRNAAECRYFWYRTRVSNERASSLEVKSASIRVVRDRDLLLNNVPNSDFVRRGLGYSSDGRSKGQRECSQVFHRNLRSSKVARIAQPPSSQRCERVMVCPI